MSTKKTVRKRREKVISISLLFFMLFRLVDPSLPCELTEEACCCSVEVSTEETVDRCCNTAPISNCSLESAPCDCGDDSHPTLYSLPSTNHIEFGDSSLEFDSFNIELPDFFGRSFRYYSRGSPNYYQPESSIALFATLHWPTVRLLC